MSKLAASLPLWRFWTEPIRAEPLACFRIALGATLLLSSFISLAGDLGFYLGERGLCRATAVDPWLNRTGRMCLLRGPIHVPVLEDVLPNDVARSWAALGDRLDTAMLLFWIWMAALAAMTVGLFSRTATVLAWLLTTTFHNRLAWLLNGGDYIAHVGLFYLMLAPAGAAWSLDDYFRRRREERIAGGPIPAKPVLIPPWSVRLIQIQLAAVYLFTGLAKLRMDGLEEIASLAWLQGNGFENDWLNGEAVYWVLNDAALTRWPYAWLPVPLWICRLLSWGTLVFEIGFPLLVLIRRVRPWLLWAGVAFHVGILVTMEIGWFSQLTLCWYVAFVPAETLERFAARLRSSIWRDAHHLPCPEPFISQPAPAPP